MPNTSPTPAHIAKPREQAATRHWLATLIVLACTGLLVDTWLLEGLLTPRIVAGGSMAPTLQGAHRQWQCTACAQTFACDLASLPVGPEAICPHCAKTMRAEPGVDRSGDRLFVDRSAFAWREPKRWETIVLRSPDESERLCVKRVVGLPGETISLVGGNVLVDGQLARKDSKTLRALSVPVCGPRAAAQRWHGSAWQSDGEGFRYSGGAQAGDSGEMHWLAYRHQEPQVAAGRDTVWDSSPYDQNESRQLSRATDLGLRFRLIARDSETVCVRCEVGGDRFLWTLAPALGTIGLEHQGRRVRQAELPQDLLSDAACWQIDVADGRAQIAVGESGVLEYDFEPSADDSDRLPVLAIGARGGAVSLAGLTVVRDVVYGTSATVNASQYRLGPDEYFVLGDNSAHSQDSRHWAAGGVRRQDLIGRVIAGRELLPGTVLGGAAFH